MDLPVSDRGDFSCWRAVDSFSYIVRNCVNETQWYDIPTAQEIGLDTLRVADAYRRQWSVPACVAQDVT